MSRQDRLRWEADGRPFALMRPARDLRDVLRGHGYTVYDIGNRDHLEHEPPEDHTPYSDTGYPGKARYGVGYAVDVMPPAAGARSKVDGKPLPSLQQLGARLLADRKAGVDGIRWLKYMNWEPERNNGGPCWHESWQPAYARRSSSDRGHIHLSGLTGFESSTIAAGYDPVARIRGASTVTITPAEFVTGMKAALADPAISKEMSRLPWAFKPAGGDLTAHAIVLDGHTDALLTANNLATNADVKTNQILELLAGSPAQVAQALVAAGQNPAALAAELTKLAG